MKLWMFMEWFFYFFAILPNHDILSAAFCCDVAKITEHIRKKKTFVRRKKDNAITFHLCERKTGWVRIWQWCALNVWYLIENFFFSSSHMNKIFKKTSKYTYSLIIIYLPSYLMLYILYIRICCVLCVRWWLCGKISLNTVSNVNNKWTKRFSLFYRKILLSRLLYCNLSIFYI